MQSNNCLNCNTTVMGKFCHECGQKTDTHRITVKHFIEHDLVHGVWHIDKGIPYTLKQIFTRPGHGALDYIHGKRVKYYNVFYLSLLVLGLFMLLTFEDKEVINALNNAPEIARNFMSTLYSYSKVFIFLFIPLSAFCGKILFDRIDLNYAEHLIIAGFIVLGCFITLLGGALIGKVLPVAEGIVVTFGVPFFYLCVYRQVTGVKYTWLGFLWRMIVYFILLMFLYMMILVPVALNAIN